MIKIECDLSYLKAALRLEKSLKVTDEGFRFNRLSSILYDMRDDKENTYYIHKDWAAYSFRFVAERIKNPSSTYNGGIICHGLGNFTGSVELCRREGIYWSVHT